MDNYKILAIILCILLFLLIIVLSSRVRILKTYEKYMKVGNKANITGKQLAFFAKDILELKNLQFALVQDKLGDAYSPKYTTLILSEEVCYTASLSSLAIVAHELGHAVQHKNSTGLFFITQLFGKITRITNKFVFPLLFIGIISFLFKYPNETLGLNIMIVSGALFLMHVLFKFLTIPLEYNASKIALKLLKEHKFVSQSELKKAKKLLKLAAQTYIASLFDGLFILNKKRKKK